MGVQFRGRCSRGSGSLPVAVGIVGVVALLSVVGIVALLSVVGIAQVVALGRSRSSSASPVVGIARVCFWPFSFFVFYCYPVFCIAFLHYNNVAHTHDARGPKNVFWALFYAENAIFSLLTFFLLFCCFLL